MIAGIPAHSAPEAVTRLIEQAMPERRGSVQAALAETLRGVVAQVLLRKSAAAASPRASCCSARRRSRR